jgi:mono/diheme cytochrome c family protein/peroxiredoxin
MAATHDETSPVDGPPKDPGNVPGNGMSVRTLAAVCGLAGAFFVAAFVGRSLRHDRVRPAVEQAAVADQRTLPGTDSDRLDRGEMVFQVYCAKCHGPDGHGDPEAIAVQKPPPRDFASRPWRYEVTLDSIRRVTREGIPGTAMPAHHAALGTADVEAVTAHVYRLATSTSAEAQDLSPLAKAMLDAGFALESAPHDAPALPLVDATENTRSLDERGRVVLLQFWGITCEHCLRGMPKLQLLADRWQSQGVTVLSVCADSETADEAQQTVARVSPTTRVWTDSSGLGNERFDVRILPTTWLIDSSGRRLAVAHGMIDWNSPAVEHMLDLLAAGTTP